MTHNEAVGLQLEKTVYINSGTNPRVGSDPVRRFTVVVTLLDPFLQPMTLHRVMPVLSTAEATHSRSSSRVGFNVPPNQ